MHWTKKLIYQGNQTKAKVSQIPHLHKCAQICSGAKMGGLKRLTPDPRTTLRTTPRTTLRTTLKNQPNSFYGVQKYKKLTCSSYTIITARKTAAIFFSYISRPSFFHFAPFFTGRPPARTHNGRSVSAVEYLSL